MNGRSMGALIMINSGVNLATDGEYYCNVNSSGFFSMRSKQNPEHQIVHDNNGLPTTELLSQLIAYQVRQGTMIGYPV
jgi:hypothetical protein